MEVVRRPTVHGVKLYVGGKEVMVGSLCVTVYHLIYSTRRHEGQDEITVSLISQNMVCIDCMTFRC